MSNIIGLFRCPSDDSTRRFDLGLSRLSHRGSEYVDAVSTTDGVLGVSRYGWECDPSVAGPATVARVASWAAVVDGALYYQTDLRQNLLAEGVSLGSGPHSTAGLIIHAFLTWGPDCLRYLEGDFAFIVWNRLTNEVFAARDFAGSRPLYWAEVGESITVTSGVDATLAVAGLNAELVPETIAANASGLPSLDDGTHYRGVKTLLAGHYAHWRPGRPGEVARWWSLPSNDPDLSMDEAAQELQALLTRAVAERAMSGGTTAVWLSGGWDSTAVMGAARNGAGAGAGPLQAVSIRYPPDDQGCEDDLIREVADYCGVPVAWVDSEELPVLAGPERAPFVHGFTGWLRGLATTSVGCAARVSLSGFGGDQLFQTSDVFLADLLRHGRLVALGREWLHPRWRGEFRTFLKWMLKPLLPAGARAAVSSLRGSPVGGSHLARELAPWMVRNERVVSPLPTAVSQESGEDNAAYETRWYLTDPYFPAVNAAVAEIALECGTELRSPLMDQRILQLALSRPQEERSQRGETKRLLRQSMKGLLPEGTLAPRSHRTGTTGDYFRRSLRRDGDWVPELFRSSRLADLGLIRPEVFLEWWRWFVQGGQGPWEVALGATIRTERWLQAGTDQSRRTAAVPGARNVRSWGPTPSRAGGSDSPTTKEGPRCTTSRRLSVSVQSGSSP